MKTARTAARQTKAYGLTYRKKSISTDPYMPRGAQGKTGVCEGCHAIYTNKRWYNNGKVPRGVAAGTETVSVVCPACLKIRDNFPGGIVTLKGDYVLGHKQN